jgi:hypothetical protein
MDGQNKPLIITDTEAIKAIVEESMRKSLENLLEQIRRDPQAGQQEGQTLLIKKTEAAKLLGISYHTLQKLVSQGILKTSPDGKKIIRQSLIDYAQGKLNPKTLSDE